jgi:hypothetical protein
VAFALSQAAKWLTITPTQGDLDLMREVLDAIRQLAKSDPNARPQHLEKAIASVLHEGHYQRRVVLEILAFCGVPQPRGRPSFDESNGDRSTWCSQPCVTERHGLGAPSTTAPRPLRQ